MVTCRLANLYFFVIAALQLLTPYSPTGKYSTALPLTFVVLANMARELWEDSQRHRDDREVNRQGGMHTHAHTHTQDARKRCCGHLIYDEGGQLLR